MVAYRSKDLFSNLFLYKQKISNSRALNACAWSNRIDLGMPWNQQYSSRWFTVVSVTIVEYLGVGEAR